MFLLLKATKGSSVVLGFFMLVTDLIIQPEKSHLKQGLDDTNCGGSAISRRVLRT